MIDEVVNDSYVLAAQLLLDAGDAESVHAYLNQSTTLPCGQYLVGLEPQVELLLLEYLIKLADQLDCELFLPYVIIRLDYDSEKLPGEQATVGRVPTDSLLLLFGRFREDILAILLLDSMLDLVRQVLGFIGFISLFLLGTALPLNLRLLEVCIIGIVFNYIIVDQVIVDVVLEEHAVGPLLHIGVLVVLVAVPVVARLEQVLLEHILQSLFSEWSILGL